MEKKAIMSDTQLPDTLRGELASMMRAMEAKYGATTTRLGVHIENLATVCAMMAQSGGFNGDERERAWKHSRDVCGEIIRDLGRVWNVDPEDAFKVAGALKEFSERAGAELLGENIPESVADEATQVLLRASTSGLPN